MAFSLRRGDGVRGESLGRLTRRWRRGCTVSRPHAVDAATTQVSRDYQTGDGAYVLVAPAKGALKKVVSDKIFAADGKYGSYGAPSEVKLKGSENRGDGDEVFEYTFVALTPARLGVRT